MNEPTIKDIRDAADKLGVELGRVDDESFSLWYIKSGGYGLSWTQMKKARLVEFTEHLEDEYDELNGRPRVCQVHRGDYGCYATPFNTMMGRDADVYYEEVHMEDRDVINFAYLIDCWMDERCISEIVLEGRTITRLAS